MGVTAICRHDCERALASAATEAGLPFVLSGLSTTPMERIREAAPHFWYQGYLPGDPARIGPLMDRLQHNGVEVLVVTIDTAVGANRENNQRAGFTIPFRASARLFVDGVLHPRWTAQVFLRTLLKDRGIPRFTNVVADPQGFRITEEPQGGFRQGRDRLDWSHLEWMRARWPGRIVLKGVAHPDDARAAVRSGLDGVIVSNHGGRQLDGAEASFDALRAIVPAVPEGFPVMVDGGFRRGTHVLKAIALGARLVFLGRPMLYGATVAGPRGVARVIVPMGRRSRSAAETSTSSRDTPCWFGPGMCASNTSRASGMSAGCATQVPSCPAPTSRSLSARTFAIAAAFASASPLIGTCAAMPPIACAPRRWQVRISNSE